jgi:beta-N-acetylhexosaminidase
MVLKAAILGIPGARLEPPTTELLHSGRPAGVILFSRNIENPAQLAGLVAALRAVLPADSVILVDQEGGRVARLRPPHWRGHPPAGRIGELHAANPLAGLRAAWITGALIGDDCARAGFDVVCAPVLDRRFPGYHDVVGDRGYSDDPDAVAALGGAMAAGLLAAGVVPVIKHLPGHGRAKVDSHLALPTDEDGDDADLQPFIANARLPWAMTAHLLYPRYDPLHPATLSRNIIAEVIRGRIGFDGVLVSDDLAMQALSGAPELLAKAALEAGCDLAMYCAGDDAANARVLAACGNVTDKAMLRLAAARETVRHARLALNSVALAAERDALISC